MTYQVCDVCKSSTLLNGYDRSYIYTCEKAGYKDIRICSPCYATHILKFYPESHIAQYIRDNAAQYGVGQDVL